MDLKVILRVILRAVLFILKSDASYVLKSEGRKQILNCEVMLQGLEDDSVVVK
ncbi:hypothetical protein ES702_07712 [subsurface metagenome]